MNSGHGQNDSSGGSVSKSGTGVVVDKQVKRPLIIHPKNFILFALALVALVMTLVQPVQAAFWITNSPMITARFQHTATLLPNGKVLLAGGGNDSGYTANAELYDPATGVGTATASMNSSRELHTATFLPNGKVLVAGGYGGSRYLASAELFDPNTGLWTNTGVMNTPRQNHTSTLLANGKVLVAGGTGNNGALTNAELFDPISGTWSVTGSLNVARVEHTATLLPNGQVLVAGGSDSNGNPLSSVELFDPKSGKWIKTNSLNTARYGHTATLLPNGQVLIAAGTTNYLVTGNAAISSTEIYNPSNGTWTPTSSLNGARVWHTATLLPNGQVMVAGGTTNFNGSSASFLSSTEIYDPSTGTWTVTNSLNTAREGHTATLMANGKVLITGGLGMALFLTSTEVYDYANGMWTNTGVMQAALQTEFTATLLTNGQVLVAGGIGNYGTDLSNAEIYDPAAGTWMNTSAMTTIRYSHTATLLPNGKVLVAGGRNNSVLSSAELYDPATASWTATGSMNVDRTEFTATLLLNGKVLVAGGYNYDTGGGELSSAEIYDPATGTWTMTGSLNTTREDHTATLLSNGNVLVAGGYNGSAISSVELYDPFTGIWIETNSMTTARDGHTAILLPDGMVLVAGGFRSGSPFSVYLSSAELYDPVTGTWTATGAMSNNRVYCTATLLLNGEVSVAGGNNGSTFLSGSELYDPATGTWTSTGLLSTGRMYHKAVFLPRGKVLVVGGQGDYEGNGLSSAELYDVGLGYSNSWQPQIIAFTSSLNLGSSLVVAGAQFRGIAEGSSGNSQDSPADYPLVQLRSLESGRTVFLSSTNWSANSVTSLPVWNFPPGWALATVFVNGIPSPSRIVNVSVPVPASPTLTGATMQTNGAFSFTFTNSVGALFGVLASTNLALPLTSWTALGGVTEVAPGQFQFTDTKATNSKNFYQIRSP